MAKARKKSRKHHEHVLPIGPHAARVTHGKMRCKTCARRHSRSDHWNHHEPGHVKGRLYFGRTERPQRKHRGGVKTAEARSAAARKGARTRKHEENVRKHAAKKAAETRERRTRRAGMSFAPRFAA